MITTPIGLKLNRTLLVQFREALDQREAKLADALLLATLPPPGSKLSLHLHGSGHVRLSQATQIMMERVRELNEAEATSTEWRTAVTVTNQALWEYVEVLQSAVQELIEQLGQVDLNGWTADFFGTVAGFKSLLAHRIEDLIWLYRRLTELFLAYRATCHKQKNLWMVIGKLWSRFAGILDPSIIKQLFKTEEALSISFKSFSAGFEAFNALEAKWKERGEQFFHYSGFQDLPEEAQKTLSTLYRLVKIWEENTRQAMLKQNDIVTAIKNVAKAGVISAHFKEYFKVIRRGLFQLSLQWQASHDENLLNTVGELKRELITLGSFISSYREILLRSDPNPYKRARWSLTQWIVGPEPRKTRDLLHLSYEVETVAKWFSHLISAIERGPSADVGFKQHALQRQINELLHEMGQPLSSRALLQTKAERLIELLDAADELGGSVGEVHALLTDVFLRSLRYDIKYQVLHDYPRFEELYAIHKGFLRPLHDVKHAQRMKLFQHVVHHAEFWISQHKVAEHAHDLEIDEVAIQEVLQQLLAAIQRKELPQDGIWEGYFQMLLEYRYLFSCFFHRLRSFDMDSKQVRHQFAFLDQYLEAIELQLREHPN